MKHHLKRLKLPAKHSECEKVAARSAKENLDHLAYLLALIVAFSTGRPQGVVLLFGRTN